MLTFTFAEDESGDVVFSFGDGSSRYFVVAMIATTAPDRLREVLEVVRKESKLPAKYEFKFHSLSFTRLRRRVFHAFSQADFSIWAVMTDKNHLPDTFRLMSDLDFFSYFVSELIGKVPRNVREGGTFIMDEFGSSSRLKMELRHVLKMR